MNQLLLFFFVQAAIIAVCASAYVSVAKFPRQTKDLDFSDARRYPTAGFRQAPHEGRSNALINGATCTGRAMMQSNEPRSICP